MSNEPIYSDLLDDDPGLSSLVEEFVVDLRMARVELEAALAAGDAAAVHAIAHTWRGAAGGHGFDLLSEVAGELDDAVTRAGTVDEGVRRAAAGFFAVADRVRPGRPN